MKRTYDYEKKPSQSTASVKPTASFLQTRGFAPLQTDLDEDATPRPSGYTENFLEKIINQRSTESSDTPVQAKPMNRLKALQSQHMAIQAKLSIGEPNDKYEKEADNTAAMVVQQINSPTQEQSVQREAAMEEEEELQMKPISSIQREAAMEEEDEELQMKSEVSAIEDSTIQAKAEIEGNDRELSEETQPNQTGLPKTLKTGIESLSGIPMDNVNVHYNSSSPAQFNALAYAQGSDIHVAAGQEEHLPHEAWHVVQQAQGRVKPTRQMVSTVSVNDDQGLEHEADKMGKRAMSIQREQGALNSRYSVPVTRANSTLQRVIHADYAPATTLAKGVRDAMNGMATSMSSALKDEATPLKTSTVSPISKFATVVAAGNPSIFTTPERKRDVLKQAGTIIETSAKEQATTLETAEHGHSLGRHGPELTNDQLKNRLTTGVAADGAFSPTPGASTKFKSYETYLDTRQTVITELKGAIVATRNHLKNELKAYQMAKKAFEDEPAGPDKAPGKPLALAVGTTRQAIVDKVTTIGQDNPTYIPVKFNPGAVAPANWIVTYGGYKVGHDHGKAIGSGFSGVAGSEQDVTNTRTQAVGPGGWTRHDDMGDIVKTFSAIDCPANDTPVFPALDPTAWVFGQHFPSDTPVGFRI